MMLAKKSLSTRAACQTAAGKIQILSVPRPARRFVAVRASATYDATTSEDALGLSRRHLLLTVPGAIVLSGVAQQASAAEYQTFLGYNQVCL